MRYLNIGGHRIAIARLDEILEKAEAAATGGESAVRGELLRLVKVYNHVPPPAEKEYESALFAEYLASEGRGTERGGKQGGAGRTGREGPGGGESGGNEP